MFRQTMIRLNVKNTFKVFVENAGEYYTFVWCRTFDFIKPFVMYLILEKYKCKLFSVKCLGIVNILLLNESYLNSFFSSSRIIQMIRPWPLAPRTVTNYIVVKTSLKTLKRVNTII